jgi:hypothetical protein
MFEGLKSRLDRFLQEATPLADRRSQAQALQDAMLEARVAMRTMQDALAATGRELDVERRQAEDAERRRGLAAQIGDQETVAVAERYATRHRERAGVLERKLAVQQEELRLAEREVEEITRALQSAPSAAGSDSLRDAWAELEQAGQARPGVDPNDSLLQAELDQARRKAAVDEQLAYLKKKMGRE